MRSKFFVLLFLFCGLQTMSQEADTAYRMSTLPVLTASLDGYYRYNFNAPPDVLNNFSRFTASQNSFELGMASVSLYHTYKKVSAVIDLGFGRRAEELNYTDGDHPSLFAVKQAYLSYRPVERLAITFGKFFSNTGYEKVDAYRNENYSTSYLFSYGPLFFTGVKAEYRIKGNTYFMAGVANPADFTTTTSPVKTAIARLRTASRSGKLQLHLDYTGYGGLSTPRLLTPAYILYKGLSQLDLTVQDSVSHQFVVGLTARAQTADNGETKEYGGAALFLSYLPTQKAGVHLRTEYLTDKDVLKIGGTIFETTLSGDFRIDEHLRFIPEIRYDKGSLKIFQDKNSLGTDHSITALVAAVYLF